MNAYMLNEMTYDCDVHGSFGRTLTIAPRGLQTLFQGKRVSSATAGSRGDGRASYDTMHARHRNPLGLDLELKTVIGTIENHKNAKVHTSIIEMNTNGCLRLKYYINARDKCCSWLQGHWILKSTSKIEKQANCTKDYLSYSYCTLTNYDIPLCTHTSNMMNRNTASTCGLMVWNRRWYLHVTQWYDGDTIDDCL